MKSKRGALSKREDAGAAGNRITAAPIIRQVVQKPGTIESQPGRESIGRSELECAQPIVSRSLPGRRRPRVLVVTADRPGPGVVIEADRCSPRRRGAAVEDDAGGAALP